MEVAETKKIFWKQTGLALLFLFPWIVFGVLSYEHRNTPRDPSPAANPRREAILHKVLDEDIGGWTQMSWPDKEEALQRAILFFQIRLNIGIMNSPAFYVKEMDAFIRTYDPLRKKVNLLEALRYLAIRNDDFYDGQDPVKTKERILGSAVSQQVEK